MADDLNFLDGGSVSRSIAFDLIGTVYYQRAKMVWGVDGAVADVSAAAPLPVDTEIALADLDTGAGTDNKGALGILLAASGGGVLLPGDATNGAKVQIATAPPASRTGDSIAAALAVDKLMNNLTGVTPQFASIAVASSGDNPIISAPGALNFILIHAMILVPAAAVQVKLRSAANDKSGAMSLIANSGFVLPFNPVGWAKMNVNEAFNLNLSSAQAVAGLVQYTVVT